ncbi:MAG: type II secretion system F family protein [Deltaproteobacteria bacterium]|jgi:type IV pilus assembly protein PilC|nr:type II secretion system F family protein [Deltaproteobacteria bacterium]
MPKFSYRAITETGTTTRGEIEAESADKASSQLASQGYIPTRVKEERAAGTGIQLATLFDSLFPVKAPELILFTKQFNTLIRAGVPMLTLLRVLEEQTEHPKLQKVLGNIRRDIKEGSSLHEAFRQYPKVFSPLYCNMLKAGEASGSLNEVLDRLTYIIEHEHKVKSDIKSALMYPIIVVCFLIIAFIVLLTGVIPRFVSIFKSAGLQLPLPTKICMLMYGFLVNYWYIAIGIAVVGTVSLYLFLKTPQGRYLFSKTIMKLPIVGPLFSKSAISRFASIFSILQSSGIDILQTMDILSETIGNAAISHELDGIRNRLAEGHGIAGPLSSAQYFTPMLINMVAIGEESGNLEELLQDVAMHYDTEVEYSMKKLSEAIGPVLTVGLAVVVGFFAMAIFLPMWDLTLMAR